MAAIAWDIKIGRDTKTKHKPMRRLRSMGLETNLWFASRRWVYRFHATQKQGQTNLIVFAWLQKQ
jgi:hypothetical protein